MDMGLIIFCVVCWIVSVTYVARVFSRPLPRGFKEKSKLRREVISVIEASNKPDFRKDVELIAVEGERRVEYLRMYLRFADKYRALDIDSLCWRIRFSRAKLQTNLKPLQVTAEQYAVYHEFDLIIHDFWIAPDNTKQRNRDDLIRTSIYAMTHLSQAEAILSIVRERSIYKLRQIKALLKDMSDVPVPALQEGML